MASNFEKYGNQFKLELEGMRNNGIKTNVYDYQIEAVVKTRQHFETNSGVNPRPPALIVAPTGAGKSGIIAMLPYVLECQKVLILTPSKIINTQLGRAFGSPRTRTERSFFETANIFTDPNILDNFLEIPNIIVSTKDFNDRLGNLVIVNAQKFGGNSGTSLMSDDKVVVDNVKEIFKQFCTIIVDEAHHYPAPTWKAVVDNFLNKRIIFLTATPYRKGGVPILPNQSITYSISKSDIAGNTIRKCEFRNYECDSLADDDVVYNQAYYDVMEVLDLHDKMEPRFNHQAMVLVRLTDDAKKMASIFNSLAGSVVATAVTSGPKMQDNLDAFDSEHCEVRIAVVCGMLLEGYDNDRVSLCAIFRNVRSPILFSQFIGRCLRLKKLNPPDRTLATVLSYDRYKQQTLWDEIDVDPNPKEVEIFRSSCYMYTMLRYVAILYLTVFCIVCIHYTIYGLR